MQKKHYGAIEGLRTVACLGIVMMHVRANNAYEISGFVYDEIIASFTNFVFLFMVISAFGMCCGYLGKMLNNQISLEKFYAKRYGKILPFFAVLVLLDVVMSLYYLITPTFKNKTMAGVGLAIATVLKVLGIMGVQHTSSIVHSVKRDMVCYWNVPKYV